MSSGAIFARQQAAKNAAVYICRPAKPPLSFPPMRRSQSPAASLLDISSQPFVVTRHPQVLQRPSAAGQHQNQRQDMSGRIITRRTAGAGQFMIIRLQMPIARTYSPTSANPPCAVSASSVAASLNGKKVCNDPISHSRRAILGNQ